MSEDKKDVPTGIFYVGDPCLTKFNPFSEPDPSQTIEAERKQARAELRDRFAMAALTGLLANSENDKHFRDKDYAESAYFHADRMLKTRDNGEETE